MKFRELDRRLKKLGFIPMKHEQTSHRKYLSKDLKFTISIAYRHEYPDYYLQMVLKTQKQRYDRDIEKEEED